MATKIQIRRDTAANWLTSNPVLSQGEPGMEVDTGRIKYGDGVSTWANFAYSGDLARTPTDGVNTNPWRIVNVEGYKEFEYQTPGHLEIHIPITSGLANSGTNTVTVDLAGQDITGLLQSYNQGSSVRVFLNKDRGGGGDMYYLSWWAGGSITQVTGTTYTLTWSGGNLTLNQGEELTVQYYVRGTQDTRYNLNENYDYYPNQTAANTNQVVIDFDNNSSGMSGTTMNDLQNFASNSAIRFYSSMGDQIDEIRNITSVSRTNNIFTIKFDGAPINISTPTLTTFNATASVAQGNPYTSYLYLSRDLYPQLKDCIKAYDSGYFTGNIYRSGYIVFDGTTTMDFYFYGSFSEYNAAWELQLQSNYTITPTTTIEVHFYNAPTVIALYVWAPDEAGVYYGKKWFDWTTDLPQKYYGTPGNGVQGGKMNVTCTFYDQAKNYNWYETYPNVSFSTVGGSTFFDYNGGSFDNSFPFDNYNEEGLFFYSAYTGWGESRKIKVRIMYKMELLIAEHFYYWYC